MKVAGFLWYIETHEKIKFIAFLNVSLVDLNLVKGDGGYLFLSFFLFY
jgi:hypothetical protein